MLNAKAGDFLLLLTGVPCFLLSAPVASTSTLVDPLARDYALGLTEAAPVKWPQDEDRADGSTQRAASSSQLSHL